jgi:glycosyltransferase involved in cell wall biosynthesis
VATGSVVDVFEREGSLVARRLAVEVVDHGTGAGAGLLDALTVDDATVAELIEAEVAAGRIPPTDGPEDGGTLRVELRAGTGGRVVASLTGMRWAAWDRSYERSPAELADLLLGMITRDRLEVPGGARLHGGAVAGDDGRTALVLAWSGTGKSTLVAHLVHGGLHLLNDEQVAVFASGGLVGGFTRPVAIKPGGAAFLPEGIRPVSRTGDPQDLILLTGRDLGGRLRLAGRPVLVVLPERVADGPATWEAIGPAAAVEAMAANNLDLVVDPAATMAAFGGLATVAATVRLRYADAAEGAAVVRRLLDDGLSPPTSYLGAGVAVETAPAPDRGSRLARAAGVVTLDLGDEVVLFEPGRRHVVRPNPAGARRWRRLPLARWPEDPEDQAFLAELVDKGLVTEIVPAPGRRDRWTVAAEVAAGFGTSPADRSVALLLAGLAARTGGPVAVDVPDRPGAEDGPRVGRFLDALGVDAVVTSSVDPDPAMRLRSWWRRRRAPIAVLDAAGLASSCSLIRHLPGRSQVLVVDHGGRRAPRPTAGLRLAFRGLSRLGRARLVVVGAGGRVQATRRWGVSADAVVVLPFVGAALPVGDQAGDRVVLLEALGAPQDALVVTVLATTASTVRSVASLATVAAASGLEVRFVVLGSAVSAAGVRDRIGRDEIPSTVHLVDRPPSIDGFLLGAHVHLLLEGQDEQESVVVQAMHAGLPTLAVAVHGGAAVVEHGRTGWLVARPDPEVLVAALEELAEDRTLLSSLGEAALASARRDHSAQAVRIVAESLGDGARRRGRRSH